MTREEEMPLPSYKKIPYETDRVTTEYPITRCDFEQFLLKNVDTQIRRQLKVLSVVFVQAADSQVIRVTWREKPQDDEARSVIKAVGFTLR